LRLGGVNFRKKSTEWGREWERVLLKTKLRPKRVRELRWWRRLGKTRNHSTNKMAAEL